MSDIDTNALAARLADDALVALADPIEAVAVLFQGAAAILMTRYSPDQVAFLLRVFGEEMSNDVDEMIGVGAVRQ